MTDSTSNNNTTTNGTDKRKVLIFVHGMYGSNLTNTETGEHGFLSHRTILSNFLRGNRGHSSIAPPITWSEDGKTLDKDSWVPTSPVNMFTKPWEDWTETIGDDVDVRNFLWDWRRPMDETSDKFLAWILQQGLSAENRALIVSYSTGSLFAWPAISLYPELFTGWISVGGAIGAGNFILNDFTNGWYKGKLCLISTETMFSISSCYCFFEAANEPVGPLEPSESFMRNVDTQQDVDIGDMFDVDTWRRNRLGMYSALDRLGKQMTPEQETHLKNALAAARRFREAYYVRDGATSFDDPAFLAHADKSRYEHLDICMYGSESCDTTHCGWLHDGEKVRFDLDSIKGTGDGTIMNWAWKLVPGGLPHRVVHCSNSEMEHIQLMTDLKVCQTAAEMLGIEYVNAAALQDKKHSVRIMFVAVLTAAAMFFAYSMLMNATNSQDL